MKRFCLEEWLILAILSVQTILVCAGVLSRYAFSWSISFTEELTRYLLIWLACLGFPACLLKDETIRFRWTAAFQSKLIRFRRWIFLAINSLFFLFLMLTSIQMISLQSKLKQTTPVMGWTIVWVSVAIPVLSALFLYRLYKVNMTEK